MVRKLEGQELRNRAFPHLPEGWVWTNIGTVAHINPITQSPEDVAGATPVTFVPMQAVDADTGAIVTSETRPFEKVRRGYTSFRENDIIFAKITPCMENGKVALVPNLVNDLGFGSTEFHVLRSNGVTIPKYLFYYLRQESFRKAAEAAMTGSVGQWRVPAS